MGLKVERLRAIREKNGWSQRELARMCGLGEAQIHRYETGVSEPSAAYLSLIAQQLSVSTDYLVGLSDNPKGQLGDQVLTDDENAMIDTFRRDGWAGVARLSVEKATR